MIMTKRLKITHIELPDDVWHVIISYLPGEDVLRSIAKLNNHLKKLSFSYISSIKIKSMYSLQFVLPILRNMISLQKLTIASDIAISLPWLPKQINETISYLEILPPRSSSKSDISLQYELASLAEDFLPMLGELIFPSVKTFKFLIPQVLLEFNIVLCAFPNLEHAFIHSLSCATEISSNRVKKLKILHCHKLVMKSNLYVESLQELSLNDDDEKSFSNITGLNRDTITSLKLYISQKFRKPTLRLNILNNLKKLVLTHSNQEVLLKTLHNLEEISLPFIPKIESLFNHKNSLKQLNIATGSIDIEYLELLKQNFKQLKFCNSFVDNDIDFSNFPFANGHKVCIRNENQVSTYQSVGREILLHITKDMHDISIDLPNATSLSNLPLCRKIQNWLIKAEKLTHIDVNLNIWCTNGRYCFDTPNLETLIVDSNVPITLCLKLQSSLKTIIITTRVKFDFQYSPSMLDSVEYAGFVKSIIKADCMTQFAICKNLKQFTFEKCSFNRNILLRSDFELPSVNALYFNHSNICLCSDLDKIFPNVTVLQIVYPCECLCSLWGKHSCANRIFKYLKEVTLLKFRFCKDHCFRKLQELPLKRLILCNSSKNSLLIHGSNSFEEICILGCQWTGICYLPRVKHLALGQFQKMNINGCEMDIFEELLQQFENINPNLETLTVSLRNIKFQLLKIFISSLRSKFQLLYSLTILTTSNLENYEHVKEYVNILQNGKNPFYLTFSRNMNPLNGQIRQFVE